MSDMGGFAYVRDLNPYQLGAMDGHVLAAAFRECADEINRLTAELARVPKSADGKAIMPGDILWYRSPEGIVCTPVLRSWADIEATLADHDGPAAFYSSREALEAEAKDNP